MAFNKISDEYLKISKRTLIKGVASLFATLILSIGVSCGICYIFFGIKYFVYAILFGVIVVLLISIYHKWFLIFDKTWIGIIVDKRIKKIKKMHGYVSLWDVKNYENLGEIQKKYIIYLKNENGKKRKIKFYEREDLFKYFNIGDRVRHIKGFNLFEKEDKENDKQMLCMNCLRIDTSVNEKCPLCGVKLLRSSEQYSFFNL